MDRCPRRARTVDRRPNTEPQTITSQRIPTAYPDRCRATLLRALNLANRAKLFFPHR
ncbi:hypothetical protein GS582_31075 [Rhodococcus hoagii]|nr:hypothetical protein [Prescottella equi]